jgi:transcriptional regulator with XRE-family HTH domain
MMDGKIEAGFAERMGVLIQHRRLAAGLSRRQLALEVGVHRNTVLRWEIGEQIASAWMTLRVADVVGCSFMSLLPGRDAVWGEEQEAMMRERDSRRIGKRSVQAERDPQMEQQEGAA